jgi:beta-glucanase (GH16 family)
VSDKFGRRPVRPAQFMGAVRAVLRRWPILTGAVVGSLILSAAVSGGAVDAVTRGNSGWSGQGDFSQVSSIAQVITFTSTAPTTLAVGGTYTVTATGGGSGSPVTFSIDPSSTSGVCSINQGTVTFTGAGTCVIDANQAAGGFYSAAPEVKQTITVTAAANSPASGSTASPASGPTAGRTLVFNASFGGSTLNTSTWQTCYPWAKSGAGCTNFGNSQEEEWYLPSQDVVSNGALHLVATATPTRGTTQSGAPKTYPYTSGMVTTHSSFNFTYGYVQVVAQVPGGVGTWPALWLLPTNGSWPPEIDIMENWGLATQMHCTVIWGSSSNKQQSVTVVNSTSNLTSGWHTYGLLWEPGSLTWYLDGQVVATYTGSQVPSQSMYFLANLAIDGPAVSGSSFNIQSVQIYQ